MDRPHRPRWHDDYELLAAVARNLHAQRAAHYPRLVAEGRITRTIALDGLRVMRTIARCWHAIARLQPEPFGVHTPDLGGAWPYERRNHLTLSARHARTRAEANPGEFEIVGFADAVDTLFWWETADMPARLLADINIGLRDGSYATPGRQSLTWKEAA
ncbi:hypothetical protein [Sphingomonas parapaucimobilis]|uniref:hypothetical protein n=1 Tax=Sphingomonas parapaucimobilis TaxID=28213 RepID=UPI00321B4224